MKGRIYWLDNLKGFLIVLVVLGHCIQFTDENYDGNVLFNFIYSFHMPLFVFLSGYACYKSEFTLHKVALRRFCQLIIPFCIFNFINAIIIEQNYLDYFSHPQIGLWFLWVVFLISILQSVISIVSKKIHVYEELISLVAVITMTIICHSFSVCCFALNLVAYYWLYYAIGYYFRKHKNILYLMQNRYVVTVSVVLFILMSLTYNRNIVPDYVSFFPVSVYIRIVALFGIVTSVSLFCKFVNCKYQLLNFLGVNTLGIYAIHLQFIPLLIYLNLNFHNAFLYWIFVITFALLLTLISCLITLWLKKNKYTALVFFGNKSGNNEIIQRTKT